MSLITGRPLNKGWLARIENGDVVSYFVFQFNPTNTERERVVSYDLVSAPGSVLPTAIFQSIMGDKITISLFLDATDSYDNEKKGISASLAEIESFTQPQIDQFSSDVGQVPSPPLIKYGMNEDFWTVVIPRINIRTERWNSSGIPTRATVEIEMQAIYTDIAAIQARLDRLAFLRSKVIREEL